MRKTIVRVGRAILLAFALYVALVWSERRDLPWVGYAVAGGLLAVLGVLSLRTSLARRRQQREDRWERALYDAALRPRAIRELSAHLRGVSRGLRARSERARLSVMLAELHDADADYAAAMAVVDVVQLDGLSPLDAGVVSHTRAVVHLRGGDVAGALSALSGRAPSGDSELDARLDLLEAYARAERGETQAALDEAHRVEKLPALDPSVRLEARVVRAAALDVEGKREEALVTLAALGRESLRVLSDIGQPRVRELAKSVLDSSL